MKQSEQFETIMTARGPVQVVITSPVRAATGFKIFFGPKLPVGSYRVFFGPLREKHRLIKFKLKIKSMQKGLTNHPTKSYYGYKQGQLVEVQTKTENFVAMFLGVDKNLEEPRAILQSLTHDYEHVLPFKRVVKEVKL
jgi:hypothetical protein